MDRLLFGVARNVVGLELIRRTSLNRKRVLTALHICDIRNEHILNLNHSLLFAILARSIERKAIFLLVQDKELLAPDLRASVI